MSFEPQEGKMKKNQTQRINLFIPLTADSSQFKLGEMKLLCKSRIVWDHFQLKKAPFVSSWLHCWSPDPELPIKLVLRWEDFAPSSACKVMEMNLHLSSWMDGGSELHSSHLTTSFCLCDIVTSFLWPTTRWSLSHQRNTGIKSTAKF